MADKPGEQRPQRGDAVRDGGRVRVTFELGAEPFGDVVADGSAPQLTIDKQPVEVAGWNTTATVALPAGRHRLVVTFRWKTFTDLGYARASFDLSEGQERSFRYQPRQSLGPGTLEELDA